MISMNTTVSTVPADSPDARTRPDANAPVFYTYIGSPVGLLLLAASDAGLRVVEFPESRHTIAPASHWQQVDLAQLAGSPGDDGNVLTSSPAARVLWQAAQQLDEYFAGRRQHFDLPLAPHGTTFQQQVWQALRHIPFGHTWSYAELARHIGKPTASRAVGAANGRNPIAIIIPCHRVIGTNGNLTGFAGGLSAKSFLLQLEGQLLI